MKKVVTILTLLILSNIEVIAQTNPKTFLWPYNIPSDQSDGPARVKVHGEYSIKKSAYKNNNGNYGLLIRFTISRITFDDITYKHKGFVYSQESLHAADGRGSEGFNELVITGISITFPAVKGFGVINEKAFTISRDVAKTGGFGLTDEIAEFNGEDYDLDKISVMAANSFATNIKFENSSILVARIEKILKQKEDEKEYKNIISEADKANSKKNYTEAKKLYEKASRLLPNENYPKAQLSKIDKEEKKEQEKLAAEKISKEKKDDIASDKAADDFWSDKPVTNSKNNEEIAAKEKEEKKRIEQEKYQQTMATVNANLEKTRQDSKEFEDKMVSKATGVVQSYYQGQAALESKSNINSLSKLTGDYGSIDELERDFNTQYAQINQETSNFVESKKASINSRFDSSTSTDSNDAMGNEAMKLIGGLITDIEANRARKKALEELEAQKQAKLKEIEAAKINQRISLRTKLVDAFPNGGLPLSSHRITAENVYLFAYITNKAQFGNENVDIAISNVFPVAQYSDGTFPYKNSILNQLNGFGKGEVTIVGYYTNEATAKDTHETFTKLAHKTGMKVNPFSFKKEVTNTSSNAKTSTTDFWETSKKEQPKNEKKETKSDFWND